MSSSECGSPLNPLNELDRNSIAPSRMSDTSALNYGSEAGTVFSGSTVISRHPGGAGRPRVDLGVAASAHKKIRIDNPDIVLNNNLDRMEVNGYENSGGEGDAAGGSKLLIWGTRICVEDVQKAFRTFITSYCVTQVDDDENAIDLAAGERMEINLKGPLYMEKLRGISLSEVPILNLNLNHVRDFNVALYKNIIAYPADVIPYLDTTVNEIFSEVFQSDLPSAIEIRPFNVGEVKNMRELNPTDIDQLITTSGMVTRVSHLVPEMNQGFFECTICKRTEEALVEFGRIEEPVNCNDCGNSYCLQLIHNRSVFIDKQIVKLQEIPGDMPTGQTQHTVTLFVHGSLVENVHPGDRVSVTGIYRSTPIRVNPMQRSVKAVFRMSIDVIHFRKMSQNRLHEQNDGCYLTAERIEQIKQLATEPDVVERLVKLIAPNIFGHEEIKKGILCLLFGGSRKSDSEGNRAKLRSEINILLCGDPGTAKSQLLQYIYHLVPRSQYTSGKGSSAVGLSASITHDPDTKGVVLQTGALVLADNGVCCIDEFDKMSDATRSILHEVMEQQTLSIAKAGIICQLNARTSILAAANPIDSKWNKNKNIIQNLHLPHTLLSRFDLIFLVLDPESEEYDSRLGKHLVNFYLEGENDIKKERDADMAFLRDYLAYAKEFVYPKLTTEAYETLIRKYLFMREGGKKMGCITAYPRQLESLVRLSESFAKMRLSLEVEEIDVEHAYELYNEALRQSATDPSTGCVNVAILTTGVTETLKKKAEMVADLIRKEIEHRKGAVSTTKLFKDLRAVNKAVDSDTFREALDLLQRQDIITKNADRIRFLSTLKKTVA